MKKTQKNMKEGKTLISRTWHGLVPLEKKDAFEKYLAQTGIIEAENIAGNRGAFVKIVVQNNYAHFFLCTIWASMTDVYQYAGRNPTIAITYPEDEKYGLISDPIVIMQEIKHCQDPFSS